MTGGTWIRARPAPLVATVLLLAAGMVPLREGALSAAREDARSLERNRADREQAGGGYYQGLINGGGPDGTPDELAMRLLGKPADWMSFHDINATRYMKRDFLLFELRPNAAYTVFGEPFHTNRFGQRDRATYARDKPPGTFRIALLGSSIDMGWGVGDERTYENRLEDWLNAHAARRGLPRRFEVLNFAVAAYSPWQRVESYRRKARDFDPDLVLYSSSLLDTRLEDLHICKVLQAGIPVREPSIRAALKAAAITPADLRLDADGEFARKESLKRKVRSQLWRLVDDAIGTLAAAARADGVPVACLLIPRAGQSDAPDERATPAARQAGIAARHAVPLIDVTAAFDGHDPAAVSIAPWDDHPNAQGHKLLFAAIAHGLVDDPRLYRLVFDAEPPDEGEISSLKSMNIH